MRLGPLLAGGEPAPPADMCPRLCLAAATSMLASLVCKSCPALGLHPPPLCLCWATCPVQACPCLLPAGCWWRAWGGMCCFAHEQYQPETPHLQLSCKPTMAHLLPWTTNSSCLGCVPLCNVSTFAQGSCTASCRVPSIPRGMHGSCCSWRCQMASKRDKLTRSHPKPVCCPAALSWTALCPVGEARSAEAGGGIGGSVA